jgi:hypothetical protein
MVSITHRVCVGGWGRGFQICSDQGCDKKKKKQESMDPFHGSVLLPNLDTFPTSCRQHLVVMVLMGELVSVRELFKHLMLIPGNSQLTAISEYIASIFGHSAKMPAVSLS